jgi:hypothetical protein
VVQSCGHFSTYIVTFDPPHVDGGVRDDAAMMAGWLELEEETTNEIRRPVDFHCDRNARPVVAGQRILSVCVPMATWRDLPPED